MTTSNRFTALFKTETNVSSSNIRAVSKSSLEQDIKPDVLSGKKTQRKIILGHRSYEDDLYEKDPSRQRTDVYDILADKEKLAISLVKSRMCNSVDKKENCQHGTSCRFAHSLDELKVSDCLFEHRCRFVRMSNGELINNGAKVCTHKHPHENIESFMRRTGLVKYRSITRQIVVKPAPPFSHSQPPPPFSPPPQSSLRSAKITQVETQVDTQVDTQVVTQVVTQVETQVDTQVVTQVETQVDTQVDTQVSTDQMLTIRVPKRLASQALEIAIKSNKFSSVQIIIVD